LDGSNVLSDTNQDGSALAPDNPYSAGQYYSDLSATCSGLSHLGFLMQPLAQRIIEFAIENGLERLLNCPRKS